MQSTRINKACLKEVLGALREQQVASQEIRLNGDTSTRSIEHAWERRITDSNMLNHAQKLPTMQATFTTSRLSSSSPLSSSQMRRNTSFRPYHPFHPVYTQTVEDRQFTNQPMSRIMMPMRVRLLASLSSILTLWDF